MGDDDDLIFIRSVEKPRAPKGNGRQAKKRAKPNVSVQPVSPSPAAKKRVGGDQSARRVEPINMFAQAVAITAATREKLHGKQATMRAKANDVSTWAVSPSPAARAQIGDTQTQATASGVNSIESLPPPPDSFMLATRKALESVMGKEAVDSQEKFLAEELKCTDAYIAELQEAVKQKAGVNVSHDPITQKHLALLKAKFEGKEATAQTEIRILREHNEKLTEDKTKLTRDIKLLQDGYGALKTKAQDDASAEIQLLHENNAKLTEEKGALFRSISLLQDENRSLEATRQDREVAGAEAKTLHEQNAKLTEEKAELVRNVELLKDEHGNLRAEVSALTHDISEQKKLFASKKMQGSNNNVKATAAEVKSLKNEIKMEKKRSKTLMKRNANLSTELAEMEKKRRATLSHENAAKQSAKEVSKAHERIEKLQQQIVKLDQGFRERGEQLVELNRASESKDKMEKQKKAAIEAKGMLQTRMTGMFRHYRTLFKKNTALLDKLKSAAAAGVSEEAASTSRKELKLLKGRPLEKLDEFKNQV
jgi:cell division protein FtsB